MKTNKAASKSPTAEPCHLDTTLVHGKQNQNWEQGATLPPVVFSASFQQESAEAMADVFQGRQDGMIYSRLGNPTVDALEQRITDVCDARGTLALASGMSAVTLALLGFLKAGDELLASSLLFGGNYTLFTKTFKDLGITVHLVDPTRPGLAEGLVNERTKGVFLEAIANPAIVVPDFSTWRALCNKHGLVLVADATLLSPYLFDAEALGADVAVFSSTKYIAGPANTIGGLVVDTGHMDWLAADKLDFADYKQAGANAFLDKLRKRLMADVGPCLSPMTAFLLINGMETLGMRMERQCDNTQKLAEFLDNHPSVEEVLFPGLPKNPYHALAMRQFGGKAGSVFCFKLQDQAACFRFLNAMRLVRLATNMGDTKSLALHPASTIYSTFWKHEQEEAGVTENMIRFSVGIEHPDDLIADLAQALEA